VLDTRNGDEALRHRPWLDSDKSGVCRHRPESDPGTVVVDLRYTRREGVERYPGCVRSRCGHVYIIAASTYLSVSVQ
jgi:hypothetical protein